MEQRPNTEPYPFYIKATAVLLGLVLAVFILYVLSSVFVPLAFAVLFAILLNRLYVLLDRVMPKIPAILLTLLLAIAVLVLLFYFLSTQIAGFVDSLPLLKQKLLALLHEVQRWSKNKMGMNIDKQVSTITNGFSTGGGEMITSTLGAVIGSLGVVVLVPTYVFMLLYYKPLILNFLFEVFREENSLRVAEI
ncbi:MAG: AI-2E family transporter, partial [Flavisolibacter sp.]